MNNLPLSETSQVTVGSIQTWVDAPPTVALYFSLAGAVFIGIYILRRIRSRDNKA